PLFNIYTTLNQLNIRQGYTLCFAPLCEFSSSRLSRLRVYDPNHIDKIEYTWNKHITTLQMLLEYIIKVFSLDSIERQRIHLFMDFDELDLTSNSEKLLTELDVTDLTLIEVAIIPPCSISVSHPNTSTSEMQCSVLASQNCTYDSQHDKSNECIELELQYTDQKQNLKKLVKIQFSPTTKIDDVIKKFLKTTNLDYIDSGNVSLVELRMGNQCLPAPLFHTYKTLDQLKIRQGYTLCFAPLRELSSPRLSRLRVYGPNHIGKIEYECNKRTTTLQMLLEYIIKMFSLDSIERQRIHLFTDFEELDLTSNSEKLLTELGVTDLTMISVQIVSSLSSSMIHVECTSTNGTFLFDIPHTTTIEMLRKEAEQRFTDYCLCDFTLFDRTKVKINLSESNRTLLSLGINSGQTIYASCRLISYNSGLSTADDPNKRVPRASSLISKYQPDDVGNITKTSTMESTRTEVSVNNNNNTVDDSTKNIEFLKKNEPFTASKIPFRSIVSDDNEPTPCLVDFKIKSGNIITASTIAETPPRPVSDNNRISTSFVPSRYLYTRKFHSMPVGLSNPGNTCYMNSGLQCLAHAKPLTQFFLDDLTKDVSDGDICKDTEWNQFYTIGTVTGAYADLLRNLWLTEKNINLYSSFRPTHLKEIIGVQAARFATWDQQDAQEFMTFLLDEIHRELKENNPNNSNTIIEELFFGKIESAITCLECQHEEKTINLISFLPLPLTQQGRKFMVTFIAKYRNNDVACVNVHENGQVKNLIEAFVESFSHRYFTNKIIAMANDEELDLEMPLNQLSTSDVILVEKGDFASSNQFNRFNRSVKKLTLESCLREFCSLERLEDAWPCQQEKCKKYTKATKQLQFYSLPSILIIQLKRFSHENGLRQKVDTFIDYPINGLDLSSFILSSEKIIYDLFAVSKHMGSIYGDHYIACARHETNGKSEWYKFDDSYVSSMCYETDIVSADAYLLFYIKREKLK
ncbi:unnamed protein product, partial [Rotaria socialis]